MRVRFAGSETEFVVPFVAPGDKTTLKLLIDALYQFFFKGKEPTCSFIIKNIEDTGEFVLKDECLVVEKGYIKVFKQENKAIAKPKKKRLQRWRSRSRSPVRKRRWVSPNERRR